MNLELWDKLSSDEKQKFARVINTLLVKTFVLEKKYSTSESKTVINDDYRFIEYNTSLMTQFLKMMGWNLVEDDFNGVYMIKNDEFSNYVNLGKMATIFILVLRLLYEEAQETVSTNRDIVVKLSVILNKIEVFKLLDRIPSATERRAALIKLKMHEIIDKVKGEYESPDSMYIIYPSIIHCINEKSIQNILNTFAELECEEEVNDNLNHVDGDQEEYNNEID